MEIKTFSAGKLKENSEKKIENFYFFEILFCILFNVYRILRQRMFFFVLIYHNL